MTGILDTDDKGMINTAGGEESWEIQALERLVYTNPNMPHSDGQQIEFDISGVLSLICKM